MIYKNPYYKKIRGSFLLFISCGYCKTDIALYQKVGRGNVLRMYIERIIKSSVDLSKLPRRLECPNCREHLATKINLKQRNKIVYRMIRGVYNIREQR